MKLIPMPTIRATWCSRASDTVRSIWSRFSSTDMLEFMRWYVSLATTRHDSFLTPHSMARSAPPRLGMSARTVAGGTAGAPGPPSRHVYQCEIGVEPGPDQALAGEREELRRIDLQPAVV